MAKPIAKAKLKATAKAAGNKKSATKTISKTPSPLKLKVPKVSKKAAISKTDVNKVLKGPSKVKKPGIKVGPLNKMAIPSKVKIEGKVKSSSKDLTKVKAPEKVYSKTIDLTVNTKKSIVKKEKAPTEKLLTPVFQTETASSTPPRANAKVVTKATTLKGTIKRGDGSETKRVRIDRTGMSEDEHRWADYYDKFQREPVQQYNMSGKFDANRPLEHKVLGWGYVISNENDRLEVLFRSGVKMLISNYKS